MTARAGVRFVVALAAMVAAAGAFSLLRSGYSPDEEFTIFAVRGIAAHGLPLLPSGLLYDRGLLYSYLSWAAARATGTDLAAFRALSLACGIATLVLGYRLVRRVASVAAGAAACTLVATSLPFWAVVTTGRFYAPFLLTCVITLLWTARLACQRGPIATSSHLPAPDSPHRHLLTLFALAFAARLIHELAFTLVAIPAAGLVLSFTDAPPERPSRREWARVAIVMLTGLGAAQALLMSLHFLMPPSDGGGTMIRRFFLWQVLNLFERPAGAPLGVVLSAMVVSWLVAPRAAYRTLRLGLLAAAVVLALDLGRAALIAPPAEGWLQRVLQDDLRYPLDMFWHLARTHPLTMTTALALLVARLLEAGGEWHASERAAHLAWVAWTLWFGVIESGITTNYVLLPTVCLLAAIGIDLVAIAEHTRAIWPGRRAQSIRTALVGIGLIVAADQWPGAGTPSQRLAKARPTIDLAAIDTIRDGLRPTDVVACTDELACLLLVGRADAWLALDDYVRGRFVVERGIGPVGVYAGTPAAFTLDELFVRARPHGTASRVIVVDVFKEYPVGNSRTWLPRMLEGEHLITRTLIETPQARVVEVTTQKIGDKR